MAGVLYRPLEKPDFLEPLNSSLEKVMFIIFRNISNIQECYIIGDLKFNLLSGKKIPLKKIFFLIATARVLS